MKRIPLGLGALLLVGLTACGQKPAPAADDSAVASTALGQKVREATDKAREEMATSNIRVSEGASTLPKAEITPQGDLLIAGKRVAIVAHSQAIRSVIDFCNLAAELGDPLVIPAAEAA